MRKLILCLMTLSLVLASCSNDDDANVAIIVNAGTLSGGPFTFFVDGMPDFVSGITTDPNATGTNSTFVITDADGTILGLPPNIEALEGVNFDDAGIGSCLIWYLRYEDGLVGAEVGLSANDLQGNFELSNAITVTRNQGPVAGVLSGGPFTFCVDGLADNVSGINTDSNAIGTNRSFIITDANGVILGLPPTIAALEGVNFDEAGAGVCLIYYIRYENGIQGLEPGANTTNLDGIFSLSNSISVTRNEPNGGMIAGGPFTFTVDGSPDFVSGITLDGTQSGSNSTWVITDDNGTILGLPPTLNDLEGVDFDGAGPGVCLIWYLRYEDGTSGLTPMENVADIEGCFSFSNSISVTRN